MYAWAATNKENLDRTAHSRSSEKHCRPTVGLTDDSVDRNQRALVEPGLPNRFLPISVTTVDVHMFNADALFFIGSVR